MNPTDPSPARPAGPPAPAWALQQLIAVSRRYGADPAFVLAGGGNTSAKDASRLWVKASGHALATIDAGGFVELDRAKLEAMLADADWPSDPAAREAAFVAAVMAARARPEAGQRPSVEALLHHLLPARLVVHTHPGVVNALTCCTRGAALAAELFGDRVLWQPYVDPGLILARALRESLAAHRGRAGSDPEAILLENHGLIVAADTPEAIEQVSGQIVAAVRRRLDASGAPPAAFAGPRYEPRPELLPAYAQALTGVQPGLHVATDVSDAVRALVGAAGGRDAALAGPLTPDQIVYCRSLPLWIETLTDDPRAMARQWQEAWQAYVADHGFEPWVGLIAGAGMIAFRHSPAMAEVTRVVYADAAAVYRDAQRLGGVRPLGPRDRRFIEEWEVESYRRSVMGKKC